MIAYLLANWPNIMQLRLLLTCYTTQPQVVRGTHKIISDLDELQARYICQRSRYCSSHLRTTHTLYVGAYTLTRYVEH